MIKLSANLCKKVPIDGMSYSSQSFMAGLEIELSDVADTKQMKERIQEVYALLEESINEQIAGHREAAGPEGSCRPAASREPSRSERRPEYRRGNDARGGRDAPYPASQAQRKAIGAIANERGMSPMELADLIRQEFRKETPESLTLREASRLIGLLKDQQRQAG